jgi:hypothetical protein
LVRSWLDEGETATVGGVTRTDFSDRSMAQASVYPRIVGVAEGEAYTLDDCPQTRRRMNLFGDDEGKQTIQVHQVFRGVHFDAGEALEGSSALVTYMDWLLSWVELGGISESVKVEDGEGGTKHIEHVLTIKPVPGLEVRSDAHLRAVI